MASFLLSLPLTRLFPVDFHGNEQNPNSLRSSDFLPFVSADKKRYLWFFSYRLEPMHHINAFRPKEEKLPQIPFHSLLLTYYLIVKFRQKSEKVKSTSFCRNLPICGTPIGNRTLVSAVRGRRLNRLTMRAQRILLKDNTTFQNVWQAIWPDFPKFIWEFFRLLFSSNICAFLPIRLP